MLNSGCVTTQLTQTESPNVYKAATDRFSPEIKDLHTSAEIILKKLRFFDKSASSITKCNTWESQQRIGILSGYGKEI